MLKCPHCNGLLALKGVQTGGLRQGGKNLVFRVQSWLDRKVALSDLLLEEGYSGDLHRFEPLDREVLRTAFRAKTAVEALGLPCQPEAMPAVLSALRGWSQPAERKYLMGVQGRFWIRDGYEDYPGYAFVDDLEDVSDLI